MKPGIQRAKEALRLRVEEGLTYQGISERLGIGKQGVRSQISTAVDISTQGHSRPLGGMASRLWFSPLPKAGEVDWLGRFNQMALKYESELAAGRFRA